MVRLLFLSHRIPYPPNKGDKIRSYHMFRYLAQRYEVYLGTFVDDENDWQYTRELSLMCAGSHFAGLVPRRARLRSLRGLLRGGVLTPAYYYDKRMYRWVEGLLHSGHIHRIVVYSSAMAQYVSAGAWGNIRKVIDFVDIDSDKWAQYSARMSWPRSWLYAHEARALSRYERRVAAQFDASVFVSEAEADLFRERAPEVAGRVTYIGNGVDAAYFSPDRSYESPYPLGHTAIVFTGAMDYWPNVDAVNWFAREVFPSVRERAGTAWFYVVGSRPSASVRQLAALPNVKVTGRVDDVRPYLAHAHVAVAPLRVARGVQNKVLEAMAMARPVVATSMAMEGIAHNAGVSRADDPQVFAECVAGFLRDAHLKPQPAPSARACVIRHYDWGANLRCLESLLEGQSESRSVA